MAVTANSSQIALAFMWKYFGSPAEADDLDMYMARQGAAFAAIDYVLSGEYLRDSQDTESSEASDSRTS